VQALLPEGFPFHQFIRHIRHCIDRYIPKPRKDTNSKFKTPIWMDLYCVRKVKKKYNAWKRFTFSHSYRDYEEYFCRLQNCATKAICYKKKKYQKGVAERS